MANNDRSSELRKMMKDLEDDLDGHDLAKLDRAAVLLETHVRVLLQRAYAAGYLDCTQHPPKGGNIHVWARLMSEAYAEGLISGNR